MKMRLPKFVVNLDSPVLMKCDTVHKKFRSQYLPRHMFCFHSVFVFISVLLFFECNKLCVKIKQQQQQIITILTNIIMHLINHCEFEQHFPNSNVCVSCPLVKCLIVFQLQCFCSFTVCKFSCFCVVNNFHCSTTCQ